MPVIKLAFLDVGQGDTTIITCPETHEAIVVDCVDHEATLTYLEREQVTQLRGVIITHLHADHYKETADLLNNCKDVGTLDCEVLAASEFPVDPEYLTRTRSRKAENNPNRWPPDRDKHSTVFGQLSIQNSLAKLYNWCQENEKKCKPLQAYPDAPFPIQGNIAQNLEVLHPPLINYQRLRISGLNNISIVLRVIGTRASALLTGDLEPLSWQYLKDQNYELKSDILKFPHHGGAWNENETNDLLSVVQPSVVTISVGSNNGYDHPHAGVFNALQKRRNLRLLCTQATDKCYPPQTPIESERNSVIAKFQEQLEKDESFFFQSRDKQCPCAGSVIIELRDRPVVLQPKPAFHESLIKVHFKNHRCSIRTAATTVGGGVSTGSIDTQ